MEGQFDKQNTESRNRIFKIFVEWGKFIQGGKVKFIQPPPPQLT